VGGDLGAVHQHQQLGRGADDLVVAEIEQVHVGRGVHHAQGPIDGQGGGAGLDREALGQDHLEDVAGRDVLLGGADHLLVAAAGHVHLAHRGALHLGRHVCQQRLVGIQGGGRAQAIDHRVDALGGGAVLGLGVAVQAGMGDDFDGVLHVVEDDQGVAEGEVAKRNVVGRVVPLAHVLVVADQVETQKSDGAAVEAGQPLGGDGHAVAQDVIHDGEGVGAGDLLGPVAHPVLRGVAQELQSL
jgi:hypothetical protein